jgi:hypothetical protein
MHKREASRQSSLRAAISEQLKRLIENLALPVPELSTNAGVRGIFVSRPKNFAKKTRSSWFASQITPIKKQWQ